MSDLSVREVDSIRDAEKIIFDPEIYERIRVEGFELKKLPTENCIYIGGYLKGEIIALMVYYVREKYTTCHPYILKRYRGKFGVSFVRESFKMRPRDILYTNISQGFPKVVKFAEYFGFKYFGQRIDGDSIYCRVWG
jgi:hypothetical protein